MSQQLIITDLTPEQEGRILGTLSVGCDRETAANYVGCTVLDISRAMRQNPEFAASVRRTEATVEVGHMRQVQKAAEDVKNWRASVWWLERSSPERFGARSAGTVAIRHLRTFIQMLVDHLDDDVQSPEDRERMLNRLKQVQSYTDRIADDLWNTQPTGDEATPSTFESAFADDGTNPDEFSETDL